MKIIKSRLKQIIKEELDGAAQIRVPVREPSVSDEKYPLDTVSEEEGSDTLSTEPADNDQADVNRILRYLPNINHPAEYAKVLVAVLNWGASGKVPQITKSLKAASRGDDAFYQTLMRHLKLLKQEGGFKHVE